MQPPSGGDTEGRRLRLAVIVLAVVALLAVSVAGWLLAGPRGGAGAPSATAPGTGTTAPVTGTGTTAPVTGAAGCIAPPDAEQQDVDEDDAPETPWAHTPGQRVTVYFETKDLTPRYAGFVRTAAEVWSRGQCVDVRAVASCPASGNCSTVSLARESSDDDSTDGESEGDDRRGVRLSNKVTLFTDLLDKATDNGALATVTHEMGHALGLVHRLDEKDLMNADTDDNTNPVPDAIDYANLVVIYGSDKSD